MKHFLCYTIEPASGLEQIHQKIKRFILLGYPPYVDKDEYESGVNKALSDWSEREKEIIDAENSINWNSAKLRWK